MNSEDTIIVQQEIAVPIEEILSELKGKEEETLYILGNGFDLYHEVESKYSDFYQWLIDNANPDNDYEYFIKAMERIFPLETNPYILWSNFEEATGQFREWLIYDEYISRYKDRGTVWAENMMVHDIKRICGDIRLKMTEWANNINISNAKRKIDFSSKSWYLTFNYTELLEFTYKIKDINHIHHIHGKVRTTENVITGHNNVLLSCDSYDEDTTRAIALRTVINEVINQGKKPEQQIKKMLSFLSRANHISHIVVIGHSLNQVDWNYFSSIIDNVPEDAVWHFTKHQSKDKFTIYDFVHNIPSKKYRHPIQGACINLP